MLTIATWNVNGIRARQGQVLEWLAATKPDVVCLQEIKASIDQLPFELRDVDGYWSCWHGEKGYSGVGLLVAKTLVPEAPTYAHPPFDFEQRIATVALTLPVGEVTVASIYVPNGGKDYEAKLRFLEGLGQFAADAATDRRTIVLCGDLNVARTDRDIHPKERKPNQMGTRADERALLERVIGSGLVDVGRTLDPDNENLFTWWPPWRSMKEKNIGWRIDYVLASASLAGKVTAATVQREVGTSDHGPVVVTINLAIG